MRLRQPAFRPGLVVPERREALPAVGVSGLLPSTSSRRRSLRRRARSTHDGPGLVSQSEKFEELLDGEASLPQDAMECAAFDVTGVEGDGDETEVCGVAGSNGGTRGCGGEQSLPGGAHARLRSACRRAGWA